MKGLITFSRFKVIIVIIDICITTDDNNRFLRDYQKKKKKKSKRTLHQSINVSNPYVNCIIVDNFQQILKILKG